MLHRDKIMKRLPPHGRALAERLQFRNAPMFAVVCIGLDAWTRAKKWNAREHRAMVLPADTPPASLSWPVENLLCVIEADTGPTEKQISELALALLQAGSQPVTCYSPNNTHPFRQYRWSAAA